MDIAILTQANSYLDISPALIPVVNTSGSSLSASCNSDTSIGGDYGDSYASGTASAALNGTASSMYGNILMSVESSITSSMYSSAHSVGEASANISVTGTFLFLGSSGTHSIRFTDIYAFNGGGGGGYSCGLTINGTGSSCSDTFSVTFGTPVQISLSLWAYALGSIGNGDYAVAHYDLSKAILTDGSSIRIEEVPEPSTLLLTASALSLAAFAVRRKNR